MHFKSSNQECDMRYYYYHPQIKSWGHHKNLKICSRVFSCITKVYTHCILLKQIVFHVAFLSVQCEPKHKKILIFKKFSLWKTACQNCCATDYHNTQLSNNNCSSSNSNVTQKQSNDFSIKLTVTFVRSTIVSKHIIVRYCSPFSRLLPFFHKNRSIIFIISVFSGYYETVPNQNDWNYGLFFDISSWSASLVQPTPT